MELLWDSLEKIPNLHILASGQKKRLGIFSFYIDDLHYNLGVKILNDKYGIQTRGGCSCAGTYGHYLLNVSPELSRSITDKINSGDCSLKPGWIRLSIHPTHTNEEIHFIINALKELAENFKYWKEDYEFDFSSGRVSHKNKGTEEELINEINNSFSESFI